MEGSRGFRDNLLPTLRALPVIGSLPAPAVDLALVQPAPERLVRPPHPWRRRLPRPGSRRSSRAGSVCSRSGDPGERRRASIRLGTAQVLPLESRLGPSTCYCLFLRRRPKTGRLAVGEVVQLSADIPRGVLEDHPAARRVRTSAALPVSNLSTGGAVGLGPSEER